MANLYAILEEIYNNPKTLSCKKAGIVIENVDPGHSILDVGCGTGEFLFRLKDRFDILHGIDTSSEAIEWAKNKNKGFKNILILESDIKNCGFKENSFDCCLCLDVLEHVGNPSDLLLEIKRVLKSNGRLIVSIPNWFDIILSKILRLNRHHLHAHFPWGWKKMIRKSGFKVCSYRAIDSLLISNDTLARKLPILGKGIIIFAKN